MRLEEGQGGAKFKGRAGKQRRGKRGTYISSTHINHKTRKVSIYYPRAKKGTTRTSKSQSEDEKKKRVSSKARDASHTLSH